MINIDTIQDHHVRQALDIARKNRDSKMMEFCSKMLHCENGAFSASFAVVRYYNRFFGN